LALSGDARAALPRPACLEASAIYFRRPRMNKNFMKLLFVATSALLLSSIAQAEDMMAMNAVARPSHVKEALTGVIYLSVMNHGAKDDRLIGVKTDVAETAELHSVSNADGIFRMRPVESVAIAAGATVDLSKDLHVMLFGLKAPLVKDNSIRITLDFETAPDLIVDVPVGEQMHLEHAHEEN
jgi:copper(I)-binding protein